MTTNVKTANAQATWQTTGMSRYYGGIPDVSDYYLRPVLIGDEDFDYRAYDYNGGFYICTQIAVADKKEIEQQVEFDKIKEQYVYLMHYVPQGKAKSDSFEIQQYRMFCLQLPSLQSIDTINFETIANNPDWKWAPDIIKPSMPDYYILWNQLKDNVKELKQTEKAVATDTADATPQWIRKLYANMEREPKCDTRLVDKLKAQGQYDTIVKTGHSTLYVNVDYCSYEIADDPDVFYVKKREYYSDGTLKSFNYFLPGVYQSELLTFGPSGAYDEKGKIIYGAIQNPLFFLMNMAYYLKWMENRNHINSKTGKGKPVMKINNYIDPHAPSYGVPRLKIQTNWQIQTSGDNDEYLSILIKNDSGTETVFIFSKNNHIIWDKFNR